jgi:hypothetical protein
MSKIMGRLKPFGYKNGMDVIVAIPVATNGRAGLLDRYAIVAVDVRRFEVVAALTDQLTRGGWDQGHYFSGATEEFDERIQDATRAAIKLAGYRLADE